MLSFLSLTLLLVFVRFVFHSVLRFGFLPKFFDVNHQIRKIVKAGDTIVFDSVSRMSRNADEGIELYMSLYEQKVNLVFLKESYINTDTYRDKNSSFLDDNREFNARLFLYCHGSMKKILCQIFNTFYK